MASARAKDSSALTLAYWETPMKFLRPVLSALLLASLSTVALASDTADISVHVLDQVHGQPAPSVGVTLEAQSQDGDTWQALSHQVTNAQGRVPSMLPAGTLLHEGVYRVTFATGDWFSSHRQSTFFPSVTVTFLIQNPKQSYHIPLLLSPFGYSTYRGN
jgi:5-hydroxyisourate hydrolase